MLTAMKFYTQRPPVQTQSKPFPIDDTFEVKGSNFRPNATEDTQDVRGSERSEIQNFDIKIPKADEYDINILTEKTAEGRNSEMHSTALKEPNSALGTLKLVHDNTLTSVGYDIENYNAD